MCRRTYPSSLWVIASSVRNKLVLLIPNSPTQTVHCTNVYDVSLFVDHDVAIVSVLDLE